MPITIYPGTVKKRNLNGTYSDLVPGADANPQLANDIAEEYDPVAGVYSVGDYCIYQSVLYKCITAISTPEAFDSTKWADVSVTDEISGVKNTLNSKADEESLALRRTGSTNTGAQIESGTFFYLDGTLKRAIATIAQNASFTAQNCETVTAGGLNSLKNSSQFQDITSQCTVNSTLVSYSNVYANDYGVIVTAVLKTNINGTGQTIITLPATYPTMKRVFSCIGSYESAGGKAVGELSISAGSRDVKINISESGNNGSVYVYAPFN